MITINVGRVGAVVGLCVHLKGIINKKRMFTAINVGNVLKSSLNNNFPIIFLGVKA